MKILVTEIFQSSDGIITVNFQSQFGNAHGIWKTDSLPIIGDEYHVEIDIADELIWGINITECQDTQYVIKETPQGITIQGTVENNDNYFDIRLGDSIILLDITGEVPPITGFVKIVASQIKLYKYDI